MSFFFSQFCLEPQHIARMTKQSQIHPAVKPEILQIQELPTFHWRGIFVSHRPDLSNVAPEFIILHHRPSQVEKP